MREALELCLSCKACSSDCPAGVDMARYKSEVLYQAYRHRPRPLRHYALGQLPRWLRLAGLAPRAAAALLRSRPASALVRRLAGIDPRRPLPAPAPQRLRRWFAARPGPGGADADAGREAPRTEVVVFVDCFTEHLGPGPGRAAVALLESAGYRVRLSSPDACCGLTWITTGQLDGARRRLLRTLDTLGPDVAAGATVVGLEPSCTAALREDLPRLLPADRARAPSPRPWSPWPSCWRTPPGGGPPTSPGRRCWRSRTATSTR